MLKGPSSRATCYLGWYVFSACTLCSASQISQVSTRALGRGKGDGPVGIEIRRSAPAGTNRIRARALGLPAVTAELRPRIGSSQIDEFVLAHGAADILRELVQNEFDGGGSEMVIHFGRDMLSVSGSGRPMVLSGKR